MQAIDLTLTVDRPMPGAGSQILDTFEPRMRSVGFTANGQGDVITYRPKFFGLVFVWLYRRLADEHVTLAFEQGAAWRWPGAARRSGCRRRSPGRWRCRCRSGRCRSSRG